MKISFLSIVFYLIFFASSENICKLSFKSLDAISKSVGFFSINYFQIDVDGLYGFQILENYLQGIHRHSIPKKCLNKSEEIFSKIVKLKTRLSKIIERAVKIVSEKYKNYYNKMLNPMNLFLKVHHNWRFLHVDSQKYNDKIFFENSDNYYNEDKGDSCMIEITDNCSISNSCYNKFIRSPIGEEYVATHQLMYLELFIQNKCFLKSKSQINVLTLKKKLKNICVKLLMCNKNIIVGKTDVNDMTADLFLEIIVLCGGQLRYLDFLQFEAFNLIQKIQNPNGCFEVKNFRNTIKKRQMRSVSDKLLSREKRYNKIINGCSSHTLALGAASNGAFLQKFLLSH